MKIALIQLALILALITGEIMCIVKFVNCDFKESYKAEIIYGVSIVTGLGAVVGYLNIKDGNVN